MRDVGAAEADRAAGRLVELEHGAADRGLAAAGLADQAERLAGQTWNETSSTAFTVAVSETKPAPAATSKYLLQVATTSSGSAPFSRVRRVPRRRARRRYQRAGGDLLGAMQADRCPGVDLDQRRSLPQASMR